MFVSTLTHNFGVKRKCLYNWEYFISKKIFGKNKKKEEMFRGGVGLLLFLHLKKICWSSIIHFGFSTRVVCRFWVSNWGGSTCYTLGYNSTDSMLVSISQQREQWSQVASAQQAALSGTSRVSCFLLNKCLSAFLLEPGWRAIGVTVCWHSSKIDCNLTLYFLGQTIGYFLIFRENEKKQKLLY